MAKHLLEHIEKHGLESLTELGVKQYRHPTLPLVGLKYDQLDGDRRSRVVQECRGTVLEEANCSYRVVARPFDRFFNVDEHDIVCESRFDWSEFDVVEKVDGSLIILYWYANEWHANTSGSFGLGTITKDGPTWRELFWKTANIDLAKLDKHLTYLFELCTPWNKVVRTYRQPTAYLLGVRDTRGGHETWEFLVTDIAKELGVARPERISMRNREALATWLEERTKSDPTFEGFVLRDKNNLRLKMKSKTYLGFHKIKDNGNVILPHNLIDVVLGGEMPEVLAVMPELTTALTEVKSRLDQTHSELVTLWEATRGLSTQKDFALAVKSSQFSGLLFTARKTGALGSLKEIDSKKLAEKLFAGKTFGYDVETIA